jgi:hypothetical protein
MTIILFSDAYVPFSSMDYSYEELYYASHFIFFAFLAVLLLVSRKLGLFNEAKYLVENFLSL